MELVLALLVGIAAGALICPPLWSAVKRWRARDWPRAKAHITGVELEEIRDPEAGTYYRLRVRYRYAVGSAVFRGQEVWQPLWGNSHFHLSQAGRQLEQIRQMHVRYKESDPGVSTIDGGVKSLLHGELAA